MVRRRRKKPSAVVAVAYVRCSTDRQDLSPAAQGAAIERWAASQGVPLVATYLDIGVSGASDVADRPGLAAAIGALARGGALVVAKRDRLARDVRVAADIDALAAKAGARVLAADGTGNGDSDGDALMRDVLDVLSAHERRVIRSRTRAALAVKKARGERIGGIPFGMALASDGVHLVPAPKEQRTIRRAVALSDAGGTCRGIAGQLAREGHVGRTGRALSHTQVHRLLLAVTG